MSDRRPILRVLRRLLLGVALSAGGAVTPALGDVAAAAVAASAASADGAGAAAATDADLLAAGRTLYGEGRRADGQPLLARRAGGLMMTGAEAACVNCHRRSGFGGSEGRSYIPPVTAAALFDPQPRNGRPAYTEQTLARALRDGIDPSGRSLDYLMPRYPLSDEEIAALSRHLRQLSAQPFAATDAPQLDFATVLTPGVPAAAAATMKAALQTCFDRHNAGPVAAPGRQRLGPDVAEAPRREWKLHVWELRGAADTWPAQLTEQARRQPVLALVGGIGGADWQPVHAFCEAQETPCLFPHLEVPAPDAAGFYNLYLSRGLLLEAALVARHLAEQSPRVQRVVQVLRSDDHAAQVAAAALAQSLAARGIPSSERRLDAGPLAGQLASTAGETLILWLRGEDLAQLALIEPAEGPFYLSATLAGGERAPLPPAWKKRALMAYPFELPQHRAARQNRWRLGPTNLAANQELVQGDAEIACAALGIGIDAVAAHLHRDYLIERLEVILGRGGLAGHYPRLSLGAGQRFASKTGYLVRFAATDATRIEALGERLAP